MQSDSLGFNDGDAFHRMFWEYFAKTPWFNAETVMKLGTGVRKFYVERQNLMVQISAMMSGKTRAFFTDPASVPAVRQIFVVREDEEIFTLSSNESLQELATAMSESRERKVFFVLMSYPEIYERVREILTQMGFVEWWDFVNAREFLSELQGVPLDAWPIIKNL